MGFNSGFKGLSLRQERSLAYWAVVLNLKLPHQLAVRSMPDFDIHGSVHHDTIFTK